MGSVTAIFTSENRLHPAAQAILQETFAKGWSDPAKIHHSSSALATLLSEARESFARAFEIPSQSLYFLGESSLGFHLGINGFTPGGQTFLPATSRQESFAACSNISPSTIDVNLDGNWEVPIGRNEDFLIFPTVNLETGALGPDTSRFEGRIFVDATADPLAKIPIRWSSALWDSVSWQGPRGVGVFALSDISTWRNPLPHNDHRVVPGGASPALVVASAIALEAHIQERKESLARITTLNQMIRTFILNEIGDVDIASPANADAQLLSFSFLYVQAEQLVVDMERKGFSVDSGSACISANMEPSHVLAAMGRLTHGNIRLRLYPETSVAQVEQMLNALKDCVAEQRAAL